MDSFKYMAQGLDYSKIDTKYEYPDDYYQEESYEGL